MYIHMYYIYYTYIYVCITEPLCCILKANTTLYKYAMLQLKINYETLVFLMYLRVCKSHGQRSLAGYSTGIAKSQI